MVTLCAFDFRRYQEVDEVKLQQIEKETKIPVLNNMALSFMRLAETNNVSIQEADSFLFRAKSLLEQVL